MNRADQAPEPSMEELLASIRLIITDADKKAPHQPEANQTRVSPGEAAAPRGAEHGAGDDVFDLTDEFVFPEEPGGLPAIERRGQSQEEVLRALENYHAQGRAKPLGTDALPAPASKPAEQKPPENAPASRFGMQHRAPPPASQPVWSRRELPSAAASYQQPAPRPRQDTMPARSQAKNWAEDIQMAVPEQGPVSLVSTGAARPSLLESASEANGRPASRSSAIDPGTYTGGRNGKDDAAVALLAGKLARSAVGAMEPSELETAQQVDFEHMDAGSRAEVTERLADAIERESGGHGTPPLPSLLDEVFRQDFLREPEQSGHAPEGDAAPRMPEFAGEEPVLPVAASRPAQDVQAADSSKLEPNRETERPAPPTRPESAATAMVEAMALKPAAAPAGNPVQPLAHAQFIGAAQPAMPSHAGKTLEDAVREMLRPLLVQWLNENMPRILENAIREEIAVRGLLPKSDS